MLRRRHHARVPSGRVARGRDGRGGGAGTLSGRRPGSGARTSGSARRPPGPLVRPAASLGDRRRAGRQQIIRVAARVNRDASHSCIAPGSGASARHARAVPGGWSGSAGRPRAGCGAGPARRSLRRSRSGRGRSSCRSAPGRGNPRTETAGPTPASAVHRIGGAAVDERHDCRNIGPACVPSTVWGTASMRNRQVRLGAVLARRSGRSVPARPPRPVPGPPSRSP